MIDTVSQMDEVSRKCTVNCQFIIDIHLPCAQSSVMSRRRDERRGEERRGGANLPIAHRIYFPVSPSQQE
jgi:hypothetical protein